MRLRRNPLHFPSVAAMVVAASVVAACRPDAEVEDRVVTVHSPSACAIPASGYAIYYGAGDFPVTGDLENRFLSDVGASLTTFTAATRQLVVDISARDPSTAEDSVYRGFTLVPLAGPVDVLAWPNARACALTGSVGGAARKDMQLTASGKFLAVTGGTEPGHVPESYVVDLATGRVGQVTRDVLVARERSAAAAYAGGVLVAGGVRDDGSLVDSAERLVLNVERKEFDRVRIPLGIPRADHFAVTTGAGEVLLVGGSGPNGLLAGLEMIEPVDGVARTAGLAALEKPRKNPRVVRLANGELLVSGGSDKDGKPVAALEWLTPDASRIARPARDIDVGTSQSVVALAAGGALVVTTLAPPLVGASVIVVTPEGDLERAIAVAGNVPRVALVEAAGGAPLLWTGERWLRWRPWDGTFGVVDGATIGPSEGQAVVSADPGLVAWVDAGRVFGLRIDVRGPYTSEAGALLAEEPGPIVPDRLVSASAVSTLRFDPQLGLSLPPGASAFLTDETYEGFTATMSVREGPPPLFVLRVDSGAEAEIGGAACTAPASKELSIARRGTRIELKADGALIACDAAALGNRRVSLGLRGRGGGTTFVKNLSVDRVR